MQCSNHASFWRLVIFHVKTAQGSTKFVYVLESVDHLRADNTLEKIALKLDIFHLHYGSVGSIAELLERGGKLGRPGDLI